MADGDARDRRVTDEDVRRLCRDLLALHALDADCQGVVIAPDHGGRGTPDPDGRRFAQMACGDLARARVASDRLARCAEREALLWIAEVAHVAPGVGELALHLAKGHGPVASREALPLLEAREATLAGDSAAAATLYRVCFAAHGALDVATVRALSARVKTEARAATAAAEAAKERGVLAAWGCEVLARALRSWEDAGR